MSSAPLSTQELSMLERSSPSSTHGSRTSSSNGVSAEKSAETSCGDSSGSNTQAITPPTSDQPSEENTSDNSAQPDTPPMCNNSFMRNTYLVIQSPNGVQFLARVPPANRHIKHSSGAIGATTSTSDVAAAKVPQCYSFDSLACMPGERPEGVYGDTMRSMVTRSELPDLASLLKTAVPDEKVAKYPVATKITAATRWFPVPLDDRCEHQFFWKRLRARKGFAFYGCMYCRKRWRQSSGVPSKEEPGPLAAPVGCNQTPGPREMAMYGMNTMGADFQYCAPSVY